MPEPVVFMDSYKVREGQLEAFKEASLEIFEFVKENEPKMLFYNLYIDIGLVSV